jgi:hypothetical protein
MKYSSIEYNKKKIKWTAMRGEQIYPRSLGRLSSLDDCYTAYNHIMFKVRNLNRNFIHFFLSKNVDDLFSREYIKKD